LAEEMDYDRRPRATYTRPQVVSIGLAEQQCEDRGIAFKKSSFPFAADGKAVIARETEGLAKILTDTATDAVLGFHLIGPSAADSIAEAAVAIILGATTREIGASTRPHPTLSEVLDEAAVAVDGQMVNS
jgi:dihydrolipoamide dehydrogenase